MIRMCFKFQKEPHWFSLLLRIPFVILTMAACQSDSGTQDKTAPENQAVSDKSGEVLTLDYGVIVGRWLRPDGGYVIEIQKVDMNGQITAAYYNPRLINISQALAAQKDGKIHIFIELRDVGYPGATYSLTYEKSSDVLKGLYYQPAAGQTFDVQFVRKE